MSSPPRAEPAPSQSVGKYALFVVVTAIATVIDQWTKIWVQNNIELHARGIEVIPGLFDIVHAENPGAAFGLLGGAENRMLVFGVFTVVAIGVLGQMLWQLPKDDRLQNIALGLISSGAIGNAIDRVQKQSVTDFLRVYTDNPSIKPVLIDWFGMAEWPSFNVADAAIVVGLGMFVVHWLFFEKQEGPQEAPADAKDAPAAQT